MRHLLRSETPAPAAALLAAVLLTTAGCRASYAPHSPITGVDAPYPDAARAEVSDRGPELLAGFLADLLAEREQADVDPSFAIFPALSANRDAGVSVNGMGKWLADETARMVEVGVADARLLAGDELMGELRRTGADPRDLCSTDDVLQAAARLDVSYVVFGEVSHTTEDALEGRQSVSVRWSCLRLADRRLVALVDEGAIRGPAAAQFIARMAQPTRWSVCERGGATR